MTAPTRPPVRPGPRGPASLPLRGTHSPAGALLVAGALTALLTGCLPPADVPAPPPPAPSSESAGGASGGTAAAALQSLEVKGRAPKTGYDRELFGPAWADVDRNGCRTREDVLRRDLVDVVLEPGTDGCVVSAGVLDDPYTGDRIDFVRGEDTSALVQIEHVVAVSDAWQKGAQQWDPATREAFANDPLNLLAVDGPTNAAKGDGDAATWLPPQRSFRCAYVARQVAVKSAYALWVTAAERDAIARVLQACPGQLLPTTADAAPPAPGQAPVTTPAPAPAPRGDEPTSQPPPTAPSTTAEAKVDQRYPSCSAARDAGLGPYVAGVDAEFGWYVDADRDGEVCER